MEIKQIKNLLWSIGKTYPTLGGLLQKTYPAGGTVGEHWAHLLERCEGIHLEDVCEEYASCRKQLPERLDSLVMDILAEASDRSWKERQRLEQYEKYHRPKPGTVWDSVKKDRVGGVAIDLGVQVKEGKLSADDNTSMMDELMEWAFRSGDEPEWLGGDNE